MAPESAVVSDAFINSADGTRLAYRAWPVAGARITFAVVHGLGEHSGRYEWFARGMSQFQMATFAVDLRGHGKSDGQRGHVDSWLQWVEDAAVFVAHVESEAEGEVVPLGHSFGGCAILTTVLSGKLKHARRFVVSSPALKLKVRVPAWKANLGIVASKIAPRLAMDNGVDPRMVSRIPEVVEAYRTDLLVHSKISSRLYDEWMHASAENLERASEIKVPFLILAGSADPLIDPAGSEELHRRSPAVSELHILDGRYHEPFNDIDSEEVFTLLADWLRR